MSALDELARALDRRLTETGRGGTLDEAIRRALGRLTVHEAALAASRRSEVETPLGEATDGGAEVTS